MNRTAYRYKANCQDYRDIYKEKENIYIPRALKVFYNRCRLFVYVAQLQQNFRAHRSGRVCIVEPSRFHVYESFPATTPRLMARCPSCNVIGSLLHVQLERQSCCSIHSRRMQRRRKLNVLLFRSI